jgi:hypothetical protein
LTLSPEFHQALEIDSDKLAERDRAKDEAANVSFDIPAIETKAEVLEGKEGE